MRTLLQRVTSASVTVEGVVVGAIGPGLLVLVGVGHGDGEAEVLLLAEKIANLRIFADQAGRFNHAATEVGAAVLVVSQFTLYADTRRGRRPGFSDAARPELAAPLVERFAQALAGYGVRVERGLFGADMQVALVNDGPVTIWLDSATFGEPRHG